MSLYGWKFNTLCGKRARLAKGQKKTKGRDTIWTERVAIRESVQVLYNITIISNAIGIRECECVG